MTRSLARNDRKRDVEDAVPYNGSSHPSAGGRCPHIAPPDKCAFCGGTHGSRPTGYAGHAGRDGGDAVPYNGSSRPSAGDDAHTSPRRTNAHFAAGHMGPALQGTPVMQDGTSGRRPLQRLTVPIRRGRCPHITPPDKCAFCGGTHGARPTGYAGHAGRDVGTPPPTTVHRTRSQGTMPTHRPADICDRTGSLTG